MTLAPGVSTVAVPGGQLTYEVTTGGSAPVLAVHGISSQRRLWDWLRAIAPELTLVTPDLRGRGDSVSVQGPSSLVRHADDLVLLLDQLGLDAVHVCGMSMGAFVAVQLAARHPERVQSLILVDGGFPIATPPGMTRDLVPAAFADRLDRLARSWPSVADYLDFFVTHTAPLLDPDDPLLHGYLAHDLRDGLVRLSGAALVSDAEDVYFSDNPWASLQLPIRFLPAQWSVGADSAPAYPPDAVARYTEQAVAVRRIDQVDHAGTIMTYPGAAATATMVRDALRRPAPSAS